MILELNSDQEIRECRGLIYRANVSHFLSRNRKTSIGFNVRLNLMKKLSCKGCNACYGIWELLEEVGPDFPIEGIENAEHGKLYTIQFTVDGTDFETGYVDDFHLKLVEVEDENM